MLRIHVQTSAAAARSYYATSHGEYYAEGQDQVGDWGGKTSAMLGLTGVVTRVEFARLCENMHPQTGKPLTPRTNASRRVGLDLNLHCPKSLSLLYGLTADPEILAAFRAAVSATMSELESVASTRVRRNGQDCDRDTGNLVWAEFIHTTARPVNGIADPHLHAHCFVFNVTWDHEERRFKAVQPEPLYLQARYAEAAFHARLAKQLVDLGFDITATRTGWEISGIPYRVLKRFSRRTELIEKLAEQEGITDAKQKDALGARTRERKRLELSLSELRQVWWQRLAPDEVAAIRAVVNREVLRESPNPRATSDALRHAATHLFERESVVPVSNLLEVALRLGVGAVTPESLRTDLPHSELLVRYRDDQWWVTDREIVVEEKSMLEFARQGRGACRPIQESGRVVTDARLSSEQRAVVDHVLTSPDRVMVIRGAAGTGKTTLLRECVRSIETTGRAIVLLAPTSEAARGVLRCEGFAEADTVARFLTDPRFQSRVACGVIWVDEAGLLGGQDTARLFRIAEQLQARVVLSGDRYQHRSVSRGSVLKLLETEAGLIPAEVRTIRRQAGRYKEAVQFLSTGRTAEGFTILDELGWIREIDDATRLNVLVSEYVAALQGRQSVLVVAPTHAEGHEVTARLRDQLRQEGRLQGPQRSLIRLESRNFTTAERQHPPAYESGDVIEFHTNAPDFRAGSRLRVVKAGRASLAVIDHRSQLKLVPYSLAERFQVYHPISFGLTVGDRVRVTKNGRSVDGRKRVDNGSLHEVTGFTQAGDVVLGSGTTLASDFGHWDHGYVVTSHAAQGKTVDVVLIAESSQSFRAASREQFYVSVSRGRERVLVLTDDKAALRRAIDRTQSHPTATELIAAAVPEQPRWRAWLDRRIRSVLRVVGNLESLGRESGERPMSRSPKP